MNSSNSHDKMFYISEILRIRHENQTISENISSLEEKKKELELISEELTKSFETFGNHELQVLKGENERIKTTHMIESAENLSNYEEKLKNVVYQKEELERRLEAESEFLSKNLRERLSEYHKRTYELRCELSQKSKLYAESIVTILPNEAFKNSISFNQELCQELSNKIAQTHRIIEGNTINIKRLEALYYKLQSEYAQQCNCVPVEKSRRASMAGFKINAF